jgi:alkylation response protein AidB-like acyl-CoA dehydrogenase
LELNFVFSEEQEMLRRTVRSFFEQKSPEIEVRRLMDTLSGYDGAVWRQMAHELGLQGLAIPEEFGGSGYSFRELSIVLEEMGRVLLASPFFSTSVLAASTLIHSGDDVAKAELLPGIASGETTATLAVTEADGKWEESSVRVTAVPCSEGYELSGTKHHVLDGYTAQLVLVAARTDAGVGIFSVVGDASGLTRTPLSTVDQTRKLARLDFKATPARLVGRDGQGWKTVERVLQLAVTGLAAEQVGGAQKCLEISVDYAKSRFQFGRLIGSFQAVKHKCADMLVQIELAKTAAQYAANCAATLDPDLPIAANMAKSYCSTAYFNVAAETIQVLGGIGFTWEHPAHLYFKRAKSSELMFGDLRQHRRQLLGHLGI